MKRLSKPALFLLLFIVTLSTVTVNALAEDRRPSHLPYVGYEESHSWPGVYYGDFAELYINPGTLHYGPDDHYAVGSAAARQRHVRLLL